MSVELPCTVCGQTKPVCCGTGRPVEDTHDFNRCVTCCAPFHINERLGRFYDALEHLKYVSKEIPVHEWTEDQRAVFNLAHKILRDHRFVKVDQ